jgi:serine/threonine-protein kinase
MTITTVASLVETLRSNRLLPPDRLYELPSLQNRFSDARSLAKYLVQRNWLTVYQVNCLFHDRTAELVVGRYCILDRLGQGAVSEVFKAWDPRHERVVALKVLRAELLSDPEAVGRFAREIHLATRLEHPHLVRAFDADLTGDRYCLAMEYVEGSDLGKLVQLSGPFPIVQACDYIRQAADGLQYAHELGLVHRDIKPANLFLAVAPREGQQLPSDSRLMAAAAAPPGRFLIKILDMGLARWRQSGQSDSVYKTLTLEGALVGTADYLAPEQARNSRDVDIRADIYSLGCTFFYLLTGQPPFPGGSLMQKLYNHEQADPPAADSLRPGLDRAVVVIVQKMMAKRPEDRYQTPAEVAAALSPFSDGQPA